MIIGVFGWAISGDDLTGLIMAALLGAYLIYALIRPEKL